jgi:hypothetical protein
MQARLVGVFSIQRCNYIITGECFRGGSMQNCKSVSELNWQRLMRPPDAAPRQFRNCLSPRDSTALGQLIGNAQYIVIEINRCSHMKSTQ